MSINERRELGPLAAFTAMIAGQGAIVYLLARRLNRIDPDLSARDYFVRLAQAHSAMGLLLTDSDLKKKPDGRPIHPAFFHCVAITITSTLLWVILWILFASTYHKLPQVSRWCGAGFRRGPAEPIGPAAVNLMAQLVRRTKREAAMKHCPIGHSPRKTDTVARAMEILRDRPMPKPKAEMRRNFVPRPHAPSNG